ncbi:MAG: tetratricopeptide repeat protein [Planctomycetes bacterium]|nr:tetratricopeptide repeat protein [Planctomycetota bacterium]
MRLSCQPDRLTFAASLAGVRTRCARVMWTAAMLLACGGCSGPFSSSKQKESIGSPLTDRPIPGQTGQVQPASYVQNAPGMNAASPGQSIEAIPDQRPWLTQVGDSLKGESIARQYRKMIGQGPNEKAARQEYLDGEAMFRERRYDEAAAKFKVAAIRWPNSLLEEDAMFMRAEALFFADRYSKAIDAYSELMKKYENSRYLETIVVRDFAIARFWDQMSKDYPWYKMNLTDKHLPLLDVRANALAAYECVRLADPTGPLADDATFAAGISQFVNGRYDEAAHNFETLRKENPGSEHVPKAQLLEIRSKLRTYQGAEYDVGPLLDSEKLIDSTLTNFGDQIPGERDRLERARRAIREQKGYRDFTNGEYYFHRKCYGSAKRYYADVLKNFPDTQAAQAAQDRIAECQGKPDDPPDYWSWLGKLFGERPRPR